MDFYGVYNGLYGIILDYNGLERFFFLMGIWVLMDCSMI